MTQPQTVPAALRAAAAAHADRAAVVDGATTLSFRDLHAAVRDTARGYVALGLEPGDTVCLWAPNTWEWVVAGLAVTYAGGVLVPVNTRYKGEEVADIVERSGARLCVVADGFLGRSQVEELRTALPGMGRVTAIVSIGTTPAAGTTAFSSLPDLGAGVSGIDAIATGVGADDIADILFTSGTTGRSKGVLTTHAQTLAAARVWTQNCQVTEQDRYLVISPFFHSYGYKVGIIASVVSGCALYPMAAFDADAALAMIEAERLTIVPGAPTIFHSMLESPAFATTDTSSLRLANMGSASIPPRLIERMLSELSFELVIPAFGMTECVVATMCRPGDPDEAIATSNGRAVDGLEMRVVDPATGEVCESGTAGEIQLRGPMVMQGYLDDPEATAAAIDADGWLHTGDVGTVDADGNMRITDRLKDMYISGGFNVYPAEVEAALARLDGVVEAAVVGVPDERMGEVGKAFVIQREGADLTQEQVVAFLRERLANFKVPRHVEMVPDLPRNASHKVLKPELRARG
ncbi:Long-chain-fatty-acid--CoA ligase FadD13 [Nocardioides dokdonensis FR1436]|uniref:Long-chain-fatty-acid--CoA ligase FadD13 n=1 Tax=Nocardioides dokdonensis FR1436 TaxID=1300347 RepID=A0A1A9GHS4_9ACTN|nr:FadD3 family acyl-CoA ligase [Nocardioides dokdonensis]ANH37071.1 Long-chain-fatty-acid--CoA ligase FadD13 [Nocardioides dokdonensis FR1436]